MLTGRKIFHLVSPFLKILHFLFRMVPISICSYLWRLSNFLPSLFGVGFRYVLAKRLLSTVGENVYFGTNVVIKNGKGISIGNNVSVHDSCYLDGEGGIKIGDDVSIAHQTSLISFEHTWNDLSLPIKYNCTSKGEINIHDDVWIGCGVRILSGVNIYSRSIVAAGAVVNGDVEYGFIYGGIPARKIKSII
ncbi:TPA: acyltransferase [Vibrio vulnificus]|nr:acyltransferase [Vibrio vulnificus]KFK56123.1 hypothetical protein JS86_06960 [Vibrio vulnificus]MCU8573843.1 acyltransferase [Vibrio vulnificus]HDY7859013.1 acyltransferase [Vibrio vulnificus]